MGGQGVSREGNGGASEGAAAEARRQLATQSLRALFPGLLLCALVVAATQWGAPRTGIAPLALSVLVGVLMANLNLVPWQADIGISFAARRLLRFGIVLVGFRLSLDVVLSLGPGLLLLVIATVVITFVATRWMGRRLGISRGLSLLVASGFSICGASAVAAMAGVAEAEEEEVVFAIGLVTLCGSLAILLLPLLQARLGLGSDADFGRFVGLSVHDVGQVVAAAAGDSTALEAAIIVKLSRVILLAPLVGGFGLAARRRGGRLRADAPIMPLFVAGFCVAAGARTVGLVPESWLGLIRAAETLLLSAALFGLGNGVRVAKLRHIGGRPLVLALASWALIGLISWLGVSLLA